MAVQVVMPLGALGYTMPSRILHVTLQAEAGGSTVLDHLGSYPLTPKNPLPLVRRKGHNP